MSCKRCSTCAINYPIEQVKCPVCGVATWYDVHGKVDEDWFDMSQALQGKAPKKEPLPGVRHERLVSYNGQTWIHDAALWQYENVDVGMIFRVNGLVAENELFFEIGGRAIEKGKPVTEHGWWVQRVEPEGAFDNVTPEDIIGASA